MGRTLVVHDIGDFGLVGSDLNGARFGLALAQTLINDYMQHRLPSGNSYLTHPECVESYVATLMEDIDDFETLSTAQVEVLIKEAAGFLRAFIDHIDHLVTYHSQPVGIYPALPCQRRVALIVKDPST